MDERIGNAKLCCLPTQADLLIAATALVHGHDLVTGNVAHFDWINGLNLADERNVLARFVGTHLTDDQRIVVQVLAADVDGAAKLPRTAVDYAMLADLDDAEANELTEAMTQRSPGRDFAL